MAAAIIFDLFGTLIDNLDFPRYDATLADMAQALCVPADRLTAVWRAAIHEPNEGRSRRHNP